MNIENRATAKRIATLVCSVSVIILYGYAIGGAGSYLAGDGHPWPIAWGLVGGSVLVFAAFKIWRSYLEDVVILNEREKKDEEPHDADS
jgi:hypothetical protein